MSSGLPEVALPSGARVIADLHLDPLAPSPWRAFEAWLGTLSGVPALLVLGDLFEFWTGRGQARDPAYRALFALLRDLQRGGTALHFLHGNRDFLLGPAFAAAVGGQVHPLGLVGTTPRGQRILFLHGDELATRDRSYQRLRRVLRAPLTRALAGAMPAFASATAARALRRRSRRSVAGKDPVTVELQASAASAWCERAGAGRLVCGHAHRYREERLAGGQQWWILDAFGGPRDVLCLAADEALVAQGSGATRLQAGGPSLSSPGPMHAPRIIALDGPAGVGKSTLARRLARELGFFFLDTGAMYRAVTLAVLRHGVDPGDGEACAGVARELRLDFDAGGHVLLDGQPGEPRIRSTEVNQAVSRVSAHGGVRAIVVARQRELARQHVGLVAEGRDTTTVVFPDAAHKFFLTASVDERARRRAREENALDRLEEIQAEIELRDRLDSTREHAPLRAAPDARRIDTDHMGPEEVLARILAEVREGSA